MWPVLPAWEKESVPQSCRQWALAIAHSLPNAVLFPQPIIGLHCSGSVCVFFLLKALHKGPGTINWVSNRRIATESLQLLLLSNFHANSTNKRQQFLHTLSDINSRNLYQFMPSYFSLFSWEMDLSYKANSLNLDVNNYHSLKSKILKGNIFFCYLRR